MKRTLLLLLILVSGLSEKLYSQTQVADSISSVVIPSIYSTGMAPVRFNDIVVTATRTPLPLKDTPTITRIITAQQIKDQGIVTLESLLERELAGVEFHQAGYGTTMSFQGLDARYVLFMVDGERIAGETYGNIDYSRIPLSAIKRVEVVRGASSVLYGSNAMGAVVNIITRMPKKRVEIGGSLRYGTYFQLNEDEQLGTKAPSSELNKYHKKLDLPNIKGDLSVGFNLGKFRSLTTGSFRATDGYKLRGRADETRHYDSITAMKHAGMAMPISFIPARTIYDTTLYVSPDSRGLGVSGWRDWYVGEKMDYTFNHKFRVELSGNYSKKDRYDFYTSIMDDNPISGYIQSSADYGYESYEGYNVKFLMEHSPNYRNKIYLSYMRDEYFRYEKDLNHNLSPKQRHTYNIPRLLWTLNAGRSHRLTTGAELVNERLRFDLNSNAKGYDEVNGLNTAAIYVQDEILSGRKLSFVIGLRGDWNDKFGWRATPKVSAKYTFGDFSLRANYSNGYRSPSLKEMYMKLDIPIANSPTLLGNPNLKAETNHYLSLSLDYNRNWLSLSATASKSYFRNKIDARLQPSTAGGKQVMIYENIDRSELGSVELIGRFKVAHNLIFNANYNYIFQSDNAPVGSTQYIFPSPHTARFSLDYSFKIERTRLSVNTNIRYVGAKEYEDFMPYFNMPDKLVEFLNKPGMPSMEVIQILAKADYYYTGNYKAHMPAYAVVNASIHAEFRRGVGITAGLDNIFDYSPSVVSFNSGIMPGRSFFMRLDFNF